MRPLALLLALAGIAVLVGIFAWLGAADVLAAMLRVGWIGFVALIVAQLSLFLVLGAAWRAVCPGVGLPLLAWARLVREAAASCLPFSALGGVVFGARVVVLSGVEWSRAVASSVVDMTAEFIAQVAFIAIAIALLLLHSPGSGAARPLVLGLGVLVAMLVALLLAQRRGGGALKALAHRIGGRFAAAEPLDRLQNAFDRLYARPLAFALAVALHLAGWIGSGLTMWLAYWLLGVTFSPVDAVGLEGLLSGVLALGFFVPGALGVQEGGYVLAGTLYGLPPDISLAVSLLRRARDVAIGVPVLLVWQATELRRLRAKATPTPGSDAAYTPPPAPPERA